MTHYTGFDLHRQYAQIATMDENGKILIESRINNSPEDIIEFFSNVLYGRASEHHLALEPVSFWYPCYELLEDLGIKVHLANPLQVKAIASARIKTDKIDAKILAHLLRTDLLPEAYIPSKKIRNLKELLRLRASLVRLQTQIKNKIHSVLHKNAIRHQFTDIFGQAGLRWLSSLKLPFPFDLSRERYLSLYKENESQINIVTKIIEAKTKENSQAMLLTSINGLGYYLALLIISEIGDIDRFPSPKKVHSYAGIIPSLHASGDKVRTGKITKQGSAWLRWALIEAAQNQGKYNSRLGLYYRKIKKKKGSKIARVATARKLATVIFAILKTGQRYHPFPRGQEDASNCSRL
jgi:transposase